MLFDANLLRRVMPLTAMQARVATPASLQPFAKVSRRKGASHRQATSWRSSTSRTRPRRRCARATCCPSRAPARPVHGRHRHSTRPCAQPSGAALSTASTSSESSHPRNLSGQEHEGRGPSGCSGMSPRRAETSRQSLQPGRGRLSLSSSRAHPAAARAHPAAPQHRCSLFRQAYRRRIDGQGAGWPGPGELRRSAIYLRRLSIPALLSKIGRSLPEPRWRMCRGQCFILIRAIGFLQPK